MYWISEWMYIPVRSSHWGLFWVEHVYFVKWLITDFSEWGEAKWKKICKENRNWGKKNQLDFHFANKMFTFSEHNDKGSSIISATFIF